MFSPSARGWLRSLSLRTKLLATVAVACAVALTVGMVGLTQLAALAQRSRDVNTQALLTVSELAEVRRDFLQTRLDGLADERLPSASGTEHTAYRTDVDAVNAALAASGADPALTATDRHTVDTITGAWQSYATVVGGQLLNLARAGRVADYTALRNGTVKPVSKTLNDSLTALQADRSADPHMRVLIAHMLTTEGAAHGQTPANLGRDRGPALDADPRRPAAPGAERAVEGQGRRPARPSTFPRRPVPAVSGRAGAAP